MPILKLTDICKDYIQGKEPVRVLKNINLTVERGDYLAIMGPSGSGKTTLMNIIGCLDVPTSGSYELDGRNLKDMSDDDLAEIRNKHLGFVFQSFHLLSGWPLPGPWWESRICCWRMSPPALWIPRPETRSWIFSTGSARRA